MNKNWGIVEGSGLGLLKMYASVFLKELRGVKEVLTHNFQTLARDSFMN